MMYIVLDMEREIQWHCNQKINLSDISSVIEVQADGDELDWIKSNITGIMFSKNRVQSWTGEQAKFIANSVPNVFNKS